MPVSPIRNRISRIAQKGRRKFKRLKGKFSIRFKNKALAKEAIDKLEKAGFESKRIKELSYTRAGA